MSKLARTRAEEKFTATKNKEEQLLQKREIARQETTDKVARLRSLRLAKEAADKEAADEAEAEKTAAKNKMSSR